MLGASGCTLAGGLFSAAAAFFGGLLSELVGTGLAHRDVDGFDALACAKCVELGAFAAEFFLAQAAGICDALGELAKERQNKHNRDNDQLTVAAKPVQYLRCIHDVLTTRLSSPGLRERPVDQLEQSLAR